VKGLKPDTRGAKPTFRSGVHKVRGALPMSTTLEHYNKRRKGIWIRRTDSKVAGTRGGQLGVPRFLKIPQGCVGGEAELRQGERVRNENGYGVLGVRAKKREYKRHDKAANGEGQPVGD